VQTKDLRARLAILAAAAKYDASCASSGSRNAPPAGALGSTDGMGICHSYTPDGRCVSLLKILLTNACIYDCQYCVNRASNDVPRARFSPQEVVELTLEFYRRNYIEGLFLSSGVVRSPDATMEQLVEVARSLREDHVFHGYVHLKVVPGASPELVRRAGLHADRVSANIELPTPGDLLSLAPEKSFAQVEDVMTRVSEGIAEGREGGRRAAPPSFAPAGQSTQMIVGATPTPDAEILSTAERLYAAYGLRRVYYSAFSPIEGADPRLPPSAPPLQREHRLYQADWMIRLEGFRSDELTTPGQPDLPLDIDPKLAWALRHRGDFPVDVNCEPRERLVRIPGFGRRAVERVLEARRGHRLRLEDLRRLRIPLRRARPFVVTVDHRPTHLLDATALDVLVRPGRQLDLWGART